MKKYQVLARRFRPQTFKEVVGQESVVTILKNAMQNNRVAHAYLFSGMRGIGKTTLARVLAKALNCQNPTQDLEPCNHCSSCSEISDCRSLDVIEIDGASNRGIDDIRKINETVFYAPTSGKYKIYIIDEVHMLTKEAFNALLKTLEAPPPNVKFFFATTEVHKVLPTILSRTQRLELKGLSFEQIANHLRMISDLQSRQVTDKALYLIAKHAEGSLRDSLSLFDQILCYTTDLIDEHTVEKVFGLIPADFFSKLDLAIHDNTPATVFSLIGELLINGKDLANFIDQLIEHMRLQLNLKITEDTTLYTEPQLLYILEKLIDGQILLQKSPSKQAIVEMLLLQIIETGPLISLPKLARRLLLLEKELKNTFSIEKLEPTNIKDVPQNQIDHSQSTTTFNTLSDSELTQSESPEIESQDQESVSSFLPSLTQNLSLSSPEPIATETWGTQVLSDQEFSNQEIASPFSLFLNTNLPSSVPDPEGLEPPILEKASELKSTSQNLANQEIVNSETSFEQDNWPPAQPQVVVSESSTIQQPANPEPLVQNVTNHDIINSQNPSHVQDLPRPIEDSAPVQPGAIKPEPLKNQEKSLENHPSYYDNIMRFSEVELEGIIHKN